MLTLALAPDTRELAGLRAALRAWAAERGVPEWPLTLIATELAANAMAVTPPGGTVEVSVWLEGGDLRVQVSDPGPGFGNEPVDLGDVVLPPLRQPRGRGLFLVRGLFDEVRAERREGRTVVSACKRLVHPGIARSDSDAARSDRGASGASCSGSDEAGH